jgi:hypothetical protein
MSYCSYLPSFQGKFNVINISMVIYRHSTVITKVCCFITQNDGMTMEWR